MKKICVLLMGLLLTASLTACGAKATETTQASTATETSQASAAAETTFTVGFDANFPPYGYMDDKGGYTGFDLELAEEVCKRQGWKLVKQPIDWDSKDEQLSSGAIDCIWNGFTINGREDQYTWTEAYVDNSQVFVVAADSGISAKSGLAGKVVGVQADSSALAALKDEENQENLDLAASFADLKEFADYNTAFMELEAGSIDALAMDIGVAQYQIAQKKDGYIILPEKEYLATEQYAVGFLLGNVSLRDTVQNTLTEMVKDGTFMKIAEKYAEFGLPDAVCLGK